MNKCSWLFRIQWELFKSSFDIWLDDMLEMWRMPQHLSKGMAVHCQVALKRQSTICQSHATIPWLWYPRDFDDGNLSSGNLFQMSFLVAWWDNIYKILTFLVSEKSRWKMWSKQIAIKVLISVGRRLLSIESPLSASPGGDTFKIISQNHF